MFRSASICKAVHLFFKFYRILCICSVRSNIKQSPILIKVLFSDFTLYLTIVTSISTQSYNLLLRLIVFASLHVYLCWLLKWLLDILQAYHHYVPLYLSNACCLYLKTKPWWYIYIIYIFYNYNLIKISPFISISVCFCIVTSGLR